MRVPLLLCVIVAVLCVRAVAAMGAAPPVDPPKCKAGTDCADLPAVNYVGKTAECSVCQQVLDNMRSDDESKWSAKRVCRGVRKEDAPWCAVVFSTLSRCKAVRKSIRDPLVTAKQLCNTCEMDAFPMGKRRLCENAECVVPKPCFGEPCLNLPEVSDKCVICKAIVRATREGLAPCGRMLYNIYKERLEACPAYAEHVHDRATPVEAICEACSAKPAALTSDAPLAPAGSRFCPRPVMTPVQERGKDAQTACGACLNVVHNTRYFAKLSPCEGLDAKWCDYATMELGKCEAFNTMHAATHYPTRELCTECHLCDAAWKPPAPVVPEPDDAAARKGAWSKRVERGVEHPLHAFGKVDYVRNVNPRVRDRVEQGAGIREQALPVLPVEGVREGAGEKAKCAERQEAIVRGSPLARKHKEYLPNHA